MQNHLLEQKNLRTSLLIFMVSLGALLSISLFVLQVFPNSADEYVCLFQAKTLLQGRFWNAPPPLPEVFDFSHIISRDGKWIGKYSLGWPLVLASGGLVHIPSWVINPLLGASLLVVLFQLILQLSHGNYKLALLGVVSVFFSAYFLLNSASFFAHPLGALLILLCWFFSFLYVERKQFVFSLLGGATFGYFFITRNYSAVLLTAPLCFYIFSLKENLQLKSTYLKGFLLGSCPFLISYFCYNWLITGSPLLAPRVWYDPTDKMGFYYGHNPLAAGVKILRLVAKFTLWTNPFLFGLGLACLFKNLAFRKKETPHIFFFLSFIFLMVGFSLYRYHAGNQYGPRYTYEAYPLLVLYVVCDLFLEQPMVGIQTPLISGMRKIFLMGIFLSATLAPFHLWRYGQLVRERMDLYKGVKQLGLKNAVVTIQSTTGKWIPMLPMDLVRNGTNLFPEMNGRDPRNPEVIYSWCPEKDCRLKALQEIFPHREFYSYSRGETQVHGKISRIEL